MSDNINKLFVYGSLRSGFRSSAYQYLAHYFHLLGDARVQGKLYDMGDYAAGLTSTEEKFITGELYAINSADEFDWAIAQLDDYEGMNVEKGQVPMFKREAVIVYMDEGSTTTWIYLYNGDVTGRPEITSGDLLEYLKNKR